MFINFTKAVLIQYQETDSVELPNQEQSLNVKSRKVSRNQNIHGRKNEPTEENTNKEGGGKFAGGGEESVVEKKKRISCMFTIA
ncbi:hypothetical protein L195_g013841 [Trifolium pratense]|uniref:Uncharacterized protein n=1 Tax=Trifolium pratense TaxID=57577 RepID=A0A2K3PP83_TRIPR|nr:hypothetical protein L195_g013841 [Trifolium pratense]